MLPSAVWWWLRSPACHAAAVSLLSGLVAPTPLAALVVLVGAARILQIYTVECSNRNPALGFR